MDFADFDVDMFIQDDLDFDDFEDVPATGPSPISNGITGCRQFADRDTTINANMHMCCWMKAPMHTEIVLDNEKFMFMPKKSWVSRTIRFNDMRDGHFQGKSSKRVRFEHKLWNALQITKYMPEMYRQIGVIWLNTRVIQVNRMVFGRLLRLGKATSALFNAQGSFPTHGFVELSVREIENMNVKSFGDCSDCRFFHRPDGRFSVLSDETDLDACAYVRPY